MGSSDCGTTSRSSSSLSPAGLGGTCTIAGGASSDRQAPTLGLTGDRLCTRRSVGILRLWDHQSESAQHLFHPSQVGRGSPTPARGMSPDRQTPPPGLTSDWGQSGDWGGVQILITQTASATSRSSTPPSHSRVGRAGMHSRVQEDVPPLDTCRVG